MFPSQLELDVLHAERMREAEHHRMVRQFGEPSLFERIRARLSSFNTSAPAKPESAPTVVRQAARRDVPAISQ